VINNRDYFRLRKQMDVSWSVPEQQAGGRAKIFNISLSGMSFETDRLFNPDHGMSIYFSDAGIPPLPVKGRLVWFKKVGEGKSHYQCGIRFLGDSTTDQEWIKWMDDNILKLADTGDNKILQHYLTSEYQE
jgi:hypothetical protein